MDGSEERGGAVLIAALTCLGAVVAAAAVGWASAAWFVVDGSFAASVLALPLVLCCAGVVIAAVTRSGHPGRGGGRGPARPTALRPPATLEWYPPRSSPRGQPAQGTSDRSARSR
jgi:hypothetical protein